ncbi:hypothetical protein EDB87DRAFT_103876 [Lactarius vividus]|nr:hypothetical protein EDB87DRAFT_103876 [Lactarius vividus]
MDFYIDTEPSLVLYSSTSINDIVVEDPGAGTLGKDIGEYDDHEIIVYVPPHPKWQTHFCPHPTFSSRCKMLPSPAGTAPATTPVHQITYYILHPLVFPTDPECKLWPEPCHCPSAIVDTNTCAGFQEIFILPPLQLFLIRPTTHRKAERNMMFSPLGAIRVEATLRELDLRRVEQRCGVQEFTKAARHWGWSRLRTAKRTTTGTCSWTRTLKLRR